MALWDESGAMIDVCIHLPVMTFTCNNKYKHNAHIHAVLSIQARSMVS